MASTTNADQSSTISVTQTVSLTIEVEQTFDIEGAAGLTAEQLAAITNANAFDISAIIASVLGQFNPASLGNTNVSGGLISDTINSDIVTVEEIIFNNEGQVIDVSQIQVDISNLKTSISYITSSITEISTNLIILDNSTVKINIFNELSNNLNININDLSDSININTTNISDLSDAININTTNISDLSDAININTTNISDLSDAININTTNISDLSDAININTTNISDLIDSINIIQSNIVSISNIVENFEISNNKILVKLSMDISGLLITNNDFSFSYLNSLDHSSNVILTINQINQLLGTYNFTTNDSSNNSNNSNFDISFTKEYVNDISQTFYEIMTQQPHRFDMSGNPDEVNSSSLTISWNYDSILANNTNSVVNARLANNSDLKLSQLPYINNISVDISGNNSNGWINYDTINIPTNTEYNSSSYKSLTITKFTGNNPSTKDSILSTTDPFDIRIYGNNYSQNYPNIENRALLFNDLSFSVPGVPSIPLLQSFTINRSSDINEIILNYIVNFTENNISNSSATLIEIVTKYTFNDSLRSNYYSSTLPSTVTESTDTSSLNNIAKNTNFTNTLINLLSGSKYNIKSQVKNNLNQNSYSEFSDLSLSNYTSLPDSNSISTTINTNISTSNYKNITSSFNTSNLNNNSVIYINLGGSNNSLSYSLNSAQTFEITNPHFTNQQNTNYGYGKYIDNSSNLVTINVNVNNILKQTINYDGSFGLNDASENKSNSNTFNFINIISHSPTIQDIYSNENDKGFRLKGIFSLNNIGSSDIVNAIGDASTYPYILNYEYLRHTDIGGSNQNNNYTIYIDDLTNDPSISLSNNSTSVTNVLYNFGIPSVQEFDLSFSRTYNNINSQYMYINPQNNNAIAFIGGITYTSKLNTRYITLNNNEINSTGIYNYNNTEISNLTSNYYSSINYTNNNNRLISDSNNKLTWSEGVYNLKTNVTGIYNELLVNHYCDHNSFNTSGNSKINSNRLSLANNIFEISNINLLNSDLSNIASIEYTNHNNQIKDYTLMYINGKFQTNASQAYPNINDFSYNGVNINNDFSGGNISYDLTGTLTNNNSGYKWIVFKFNMTNDKTTYNDSGTDYNYINIYNKLTSSPYSFSANLLNKLKLDGGDQSSSNNEVIGFIQQSYNNINRIGRLDRNYKSTNIWYDQLSNFSFNTIFYGASRANYGSNYTINSSNWGPLLDINNGSEDIYIYIGLKNDVNLS